MVTQDVQCCFCIHFTFAYSSEGDIDAFVMYTAKLVVIFIVEIAYFCIFIDMFVHYFHNSYSSDYRQNIWNGITQSIIVLYLMTQVLGNVKRHFILLIVDGTPLANMLTPGLK